MVRFIVTRIFWFAGYILKNFGIIIGIVEQVFKLAAGIVSLTPTRKDDAIVETLKIKFNKIQGIVYNICEKITKFYNAILKVKK